MIKAIQPVRITSNTTTTLIDSSCSLSQLVIAIANAGTTWPLRVQDQASPAHVIVPQFTVALPTDFKPLIINFDEPIPMQGGIDVVTPSGTPGEASVWATVHQGG